jgi:hypothetical protein
LFEIFKTLWNVTIQKGGEKMKELDCIPLLICLVLTILSCTVSPEVAQVQRPEGVGHDTVPKLVAITENVFGIDLQNNVPVRGVQFTIEGVAITEIRTTKRSEDFFAGCNKENGKVIMASLSGDEIAPGKGLILEIVCDKSGSARLSQIKIAR